MAKKNKKSGLSFAKYLSIFLIIVTILVLLLIYFIGILPLEYFIVLAVLFLIINFVVIMLLNSKGKIRNSIGILLSIILLIIMIVGILYEFNTLDFLKQFGFNSYKTENYNVVVLKDSNFEKISDLNKEDIAHMDSKEHDGLNEFIKNISTKIEFESIVLDDMTELVDNLVSEEVVAIILEDAQLDIIEEEDSENYEKLKIIYNDEVEITIDKIGDAVDVTKDSYNIFISGIDTYGSVTKVSRSDVNMLVTVNTNENKILLTSIPRDYYVLLPKYDEYDKLTHAGIYGIDTSIDAIENLLDTKINYYVKVNFTSLIDVVDALEGIEVNSNYDFTTQDGYHFTKGLNELNGIEALSFVRERKAFAEGDRIRGQNQQLMLTALINKVMSPTIIMNYADLLDALKDKFVTNITDTEVTDFIQMQLANNASWSIESISLDGTDSYNYTYSYQNSKLYVMKPNSKSVEKAQEKIAEVLN